MRTAVGFSNCATPVIWRMNNDRTHNHAGRPDPIDTHDEWLDRHRTLGEFERVGYAGLGEAYNRRLYHLRRRHFLRMARRLSIGPDCRALDIGCGTGFYMDCLLTRGLRDVSGIDLSPDAVDGLCRRFPDCRFAVGDIADSNPQELLGGGPFDVVTAMDVLFHIINDDRWRSAVRRSAAAVAPGGLLLISDNFPSRTLPATASQSFHSLSEYDELLSEAGLERVELSPVFFLSNGPVGSPMMSRYWHIVTAMIGKSLAVSRPLGELAGAVGGTILTGVDALLQRQTMFKSFSTKIMASRRVRPI